MPTSEPSGLLDVDANGAIDVATDILSIARHLLGLAPVPASFRDLDPFIPRWRTPEHRSDRPTRN